MTHRLILKKIDSEITLQNFLTAVFLDGIIKKFCHASRTYFFIKLNIFIWNY